MPGECLPQGRFWQPCLGLESNVGAKFDESWSVNVADGPSGAKARGLNARCRVRPVGVVEYIQEFALEIESDSLPDGNHLCYRQIIIPEMRPVKPDLRAECAWSDVLANVGKVAAAYASASGQHRWIDVIHKGAAVMKNADGALQLRCGDAVQC